MTVEAVVETRDETGTVAPDRRSPPVEPGPAALSLKDRILAGVAGWLASSLIWALGKTWRYEVKGSGHYEGLIANRIPFILTIWHDNMMAPIFWHRGEGIKPMVSHHRDGEMIARTMSRLGYRPIRGSSTRGGTVAFAEMVAELTKGHPCSVVPDGPRGPRHVFKPGTILIASRAGASLLPLTFDAAPKIVFKSWDRMKLPRPFARVALRYGTPIEVPANLDGEELERFRERVEADLNALDLAAESDLRSSAS